MSPSINPDVQLVPAGIRQLARPIRIIIGDAYSIVRYGLRNLLAQEADLELIGEAADGQAVLDQAKKLNPDVLLFDFDMPHLDGLSVLKVLNESSGKTKSLVWTESEDREKFVQAMRLGCSGIVQKRTAPNLIIKSIRKVHSGEIWLDSETTSHVMGRFASTGITESPAGKEESKAGPALTNREREIVQLVSQGHKNKDLAELMFISEQTVKNHLHNIFHKLGVSDRLELALYSISKGWHLELPNLGPGHELVSRAVPVRVKAVVGPGIQR